MKLLRKASFDCVLSRSNIPKPCKHLLEGNHQALKSSSGIFTVLRRNSDSCFGFFKSTGNSKDIVQRRLTHDMLKVTAFDWFIWVHVWFKGQRSKPHSPTRFEKAIKRFPLMICVLDQSRMQAAAEKTDGQESFLSKPFSVLKPQTVQMFSFEYSHKSAKVISFVEVSSQVLYKNVNAILFF